ncbi:MAG: putative esterase [Chlamydiales bacterium]|jgi:predicted esterase
MSNIPKPPPVTVKVLKGPSNTNIYWTGPDLSEGCLPALFYFAISGSESLSLDPFNQPVAFLSGEPLRVFSLTLPFHGEGFDKNKAVDLWVEEIQNGSDIISSFVQRVIDCIDSLIEEGFVDSENIAVAGLSRGGFIASHIAARHHSIKTVLGFAPMTIVRGNNSLADSLSLENITEQLTKKCLRFYIGNRDQRVSTAKCFEFIEMLAEKSYEKKIRSPQVELIISPSIGYMGHGTSPSVFFNGACWVKERLLNSQ